MTRADRFVALAAWVALAQGCFLFNTAEEDAGGEAGAGEGGVQRDASLPDGDPTDGGAPRDAGECDLGTTRLCSPYCSLECPDDAPYCSEFFARCGVLMSTDPRGREDCTVNLDNGNDYCYTGRLCATRSVLAEGVWSGACVDEAYCRWVRDQPELEPIRCRYSEGTLYEDGPPDDACAAGANPGAPFCGGRCGDTCPVGFGGAVFGRPACVGIGETRGFGVCVPSPRPRCDADCLECLPGQLMDCGVQGFGRIPCVCMVLSPVELPEFANNGWGTARETCLAYRDRYPGEVRCVDASGDEL